MRMGVDGQSGDTMTCRAPHARTGVDGQSGDTSTHRASRSPMGMQSGWDDVDEGGFAAKRVEADLDPELLRAAREEDIQFMLRICVFESATWEECVAKIGRPPVSTRWVDIDKGRDGRVDIRSRLVARAFRPKGEKDRFDLFASMPPWEAKRLLFRMAADLTNNAEDEHVLVFVDVRKAHINGKVEDRD